MKTLITALSLATTIILTGCAGEQVTSTPEVTSTPVITATPVVAATQTITPPSVPGGVSVTNTIYSTNTITTTNYVLSTNYVANTTVTSMASTVTSLAPVATAIPVYGSLISWLLVALGGVGTAVAGAIAVSKNNIANLHQSTLQAVVTGIENATTGVAAAIATPPPAGTVPASVTGALATANTVLSAVKASITAATVASGTATNLNTTLAKTGIGPTVS